MCPIAERREHLRHPLQTSIEFLHEPTARKFPGRCQDISEGGLRMQVPVETPIQAGHSLQITVGGVDRPEFAGLSEKPVSATVVRVDRATMMRDGTLTIGVKFDSLPAA